MSEDPSVGPAHRWFLPTEYPHLKQVESCEVCGRWRTDDEEQRACKGRVYVTLR